MECTSNSINKPKDVNVLDFGNIGILTDGALKSPQHGRYGKN